MLSYSERNVSVIETLNIIGTLCTNQQFKGGLKIRIDLNNLQVYQL